MAFYQNGSISQPDICNNVIYNTPPPPLFFQRPPNFSIPNDNKKVPLVLPPPPSPPKLLWPKNNCNVVIPLRSITPPPPPLPPLTSENELPPLPKNSPPKSPMKKQYSPPSKSKKLKNPLHEIASSYTSPKSESLCSDDGDDLSNSKSKLPLDTFESLKYENKEKLVNMGLFQELDMTEDECKVNLIEKKCKDLHNKEEGEYDSDSQCSHKSRGKNSDHSSSCESDNDRKYSQRKNYFKEKYRFSKYDRHFNYNKNNDHHSFHRENRSHRGFSHHNQRYNPRFTKQWRKNSKDPFNNRYCKPTSSHSFNKNKYNGDHFKRSENDWKLKEKFNNFDSSSESKNIKTEINGLRGKFNKINSPSLLGDKGKSLLNKKDNSHIKNFEKINSVAVTDGDVEPGECTSDEEGEMKEMDSYSDVIFSKPLTSDFYPPPGSEYSEYDQLLQLEKKRLHIDLKGNKEDSCILSSQVNQVVNDSENMFKECSKDCKYNATVPPLTVIQSSDLIPDVAIEKFVDPTKGFKLVPLSKRLGLDFAEKMSFTDLDIGVDGKVEKHFNEMTTLPLVPEENCVSDKNGVSSPIAMCNNSINPTSNVGKLPNHFSESYTAELIVSKSEVNDASDSSKLSVCAKAAFCNLKEDSCSEEKLKENISLSENLEVEINCEGASEESANTMQLNDDFKNSQNEKLEDQISKNDIDFKTPDKNLLSPTKSSRHSDTAKRNEKDKENMFRYLIQFEKESPKKSSESSTKEPTVSNVDGKSPVKTISETVTLKESAESIKSREYKSLSPFSQIYKHQRPLTRPPSPFLNRNMYLFWHSETLQFRRKNKPNSYSHFDPILKFSSSENNSKNITSPQLVSSTTNSSGKSFPLKNRIWEKTQSEKEVLSLVLFKIVRELRTSLKRTLTDDILTNCLASDSRNVKKKRKK